MLEELRAAAHQALDNCTDEGLMDLVYKLLTDEEEEEGNDQEKRKGL